MDILLRRTERSLKLVKCLRLLEDDIGICTLRFRVVSFSDENEFTAKETHLLDTPLPKPTSS